MHGEKGILQGHLGPAHLNIDAYMHGVLQPDHRHMGMWPSPPSGLRRRK